MVDPHVGWPTDPGRRGWIGSEITKAQISIDLDGEQRNALRGIVDRLVRTGTALTAVTRAAFAHHALDRALHAVALELKQGRGLVFLRGIPVDEYSTDELRLIFWGLSAYLGHAVSQSGHGDRLGEVIARLPDGQRGYTSDKELHYHNDLAEMFGLFCIRRARSGGENLLASMLAAHAILESRYPQHLQILERGFRLDRTPDSPQYDREPFSADPLPLFSTTAGLRSCWLTLPERAERCAQSLGLALSDAERAALDCVKSIIHADGFAFRATLEPGEAVFVNNYEIVHARTQFVQYDEPERRRHLLRIWLQADPPRPMRREMHLYRNESGLQGIDPKPQQQGWQA